MSGRKQFDEIGVLDAAMKTFWQHGYEATSLAQLEQATGLNKSSLYNAFNSKEELFRRCLERYGQVYGDAMLDQLDAPDFRDAVTGFFKVMRDRLEDEAVPDGCLATVAVSESCNLSADTSSTVAAGIDGMIDVFAARIDRAKSEGQLFQSVVTADLAAALVAAARGIAVLGRAECKDGQIAHAIAGTVAMIDTLTEKPHRDGN